MMSNQEESVEKAFQEGYELGAMHRKGGAKPRNLDSHIALWVDGERRPYRAHPLRADYLRGYEAGYLGQPSLVPSPR